MIKNYSVPIIETTYTTFGEIPINQVFRSGGRQYVKVSKTKALDIYSYTDKQEFIKFHHRYRITTQAYKPHQIKVKMW